jgi:hypothetical protein
MEALDAPVDVARQVAAIGLAAAAALAVLARSRRGAPEHRREPLPAAGLALALAAVVAINVVSDDEAISGAHVLGVASAALGALVANRLPLPPWSRPLLVLPGAALTVGAMQIADRPAVMWPTVAAAAVLAVLVGDSDRIHASTAAAPPLLAVSIAGMYATIPETGQILPVLVVAIPIALLGGPLRLARLGAPGAAATVVLLAAIVAEGGQTRPSSIVGGLASLGVLALEPLVRARVTPAQPPPDSWTSPRLLSLAAVHVVVVAVAARIAGLLDDLVVAAAIVAITVGVAVAALVALVRVVEPREPHGR